MKENQCFSTDPLPAPGESALCAACGIVCSRAMRLGCMRRGPVHAEHSPEKSGQCVHLGREVFKAACTCGSSTLIPIHFCELLTWKDGKKLCCPANFASMSDPDWKPIDCGSCEKWQATSSK